MKLETVKVADLHPLEKNVRKHTENQLGAFCKSLEQFGQTRAFVIDEKNNILVGNGMFQAMMRLGIKEASAYRISNLSEHQKKKLILSDNKVFSLGVDEFEVMNEMLRGIALEGDLDVAGYDPESLKILIAEPQELKEVGLSYGTVHNETVNVAPVTTTNTPTQETPTQTQAMPATPAASITKTIICPNCGEVITL